MMPVVDYRRVWGKINFWVITILTGGLIGVGYSLVVGGTPMYAFPIGSAITLGVIGFEYLYVQQPAGAWLRALNLPAFIFITTVVWTAIIAASLLWVPLLLGLKEAYGETYRASTFAQDMAVSMGVAFLMTTAFRIRSLVGGRVLMNFLIGRYHRPLREERVFMFLDLADSTRLSEELGDVRVQSLIGRFFFDIARPIARHDGETHRYIGDEIVVTWPLADAVEDARCVRCVFEIQKLIAARAPKYQADFGVIPRFRVGMHGGSVVASEIGDDKREIVYFGDTINTAARIQALCKQKDRGFLISAELLDALPELDDVVAEDIGEVALRGKARALSVVALSQAAHSRS